MPRRRLDRVRRSSSVSEPESSSLEAESLESQERKCKFFGDCLLAAAGLENIVDVLSPDGVIPLVALEPRPFRERCCLRRSLHSKRLLMWRTALRLYNPQPADPLQEGLTDDPSLRIWQVLVKWRPKIREKE